MSNALEAASLIMVPSGYENGTLASVKPNDGTGDFTFSRGSNLSATRVGPNGYIEKGYENLLLQSNSFLTSPWSRTTGATLTSGISDPDGGTNAWQLNFDGTANARLEQQVSVVNGGVYTFSFYGRVSSGTKDINVGAVGQLTTKTLTTEWQRIELFGVTTGTITFPQIRTKDTSVYSIEIYQAQFNQGLVAYPYIETTAASVAGGILEDMPRLDWASGSPSLLLEPSRTNLLTHSEYYNGWTQSGTTLTTNTTETLSPEGLYNASKLVGNGTTGVINSGIAKTGIVGVSVYLKSVSGSVNVTFKDPYGVLANEVKSVTTEWQRFDFIGDNGLSFAGFWIDDIPASGIYMWGAQLEQGSYPTSYIPTYGASQTRLAEDVELPSLSSVFDSTGSFTLFFEIERLSSSVQQQILYIRGLGYFRLDATADNRLKFVIYGGGASVSEANSGVNTFVAGTSSKIIYKQNGTIGQCFVNGQEITNVNPTILTGFFTFYQRNENHIKHKEVYFPTALSDEECIQLTTV